MALSEKATRRWLYAAAVYNLAWGAAVGLKPGWLLRLTGLPRDEPKTPWQVVGMMVMVYAPAYFWAARRPSLRGELVSVGLLGKMLGPAGFVQSALTGRLPLRFGLTIATNDVIWWPAFVRIVRGSVHDRGGARKFLLDQEQD